MTCSATLRPCIDATDDSGSFPDRSPAAYTWGTFDWQWWFTGT